jgi:hypothetical protein
MVLYLAKNLSNYYWQQQECLVVELELRGLTRKKKKL